MKAFLNATDVTDPNSAKILVTERVTEELFSQCLAVACSLFIFKDSKGVNISV
jgi:hypothetical protein